MADGWAFTQLEENYCWVMSMCEAGLRKTSNSMARGHTIQLTDVEQLVSSNCVKRLVWGSWQHMGGQWWFEDAELRTQPTI